VSTHGGRQRILDVFLGSVARISRFTGIPLLLIKWLAPFISWSVRVLGMMMPCRKLSSRRCRCIIVGFVRRMVVVGNMRAVTITIRDPSAPSRRRTWMRHRLAKRRGARGRWNVRILAIQTRKGRARRFTKSFSAEIFSCTSAHGG
jgi:hypothetical protein